MLSRKDSNCFDLHLFQWKRIFAFLIIAEFRYKLYSEHIAKDLKVQKWYYICISVWLYICYLHTKLQIIIAVQKSFPIMLDFIFKLLKYFMPCTELSYRYSCKNLWTISFLLFTTGWLSIGYSTNFSFVLFEISTWLTVILFTLCRLCCKVFDNMTQINWKIRGFLNIFLIFTAYKIFCTEPFAW